jgi:ribosomal protein S18 acetylase RimI-like enzyme
VIRKAMHSDIKSIAKIHGDSLPYSLLPRLGERFLRKKFYPVILGSDNALLLVKEQQGEVVGFALFVFNSRLMTQEIMKHKISLTIAVMKKAFSDYKIFFGVLGRLKGPEIIFSRGKARKTISEDRIYDMDEIPEFCALAVSSKFRNRGIGRELTEKGLSMLRGKNRAKCIAKPASYLVHDFFLKLGFCDIGKEVRHTNERFLMIYDISQT